MPYTALITAAYKSAFSQFSSFQTQQLCGLNMHFQRYIMSPSPGLFLSLTPFDFNCCQNMDSPPLLHNNSVMCQIFWGLFGSALTSPLPWNRCICTHKVFMYLRRISIAFIWGGEKESKYISRKSLASHPYVNATDWCAGLNQFHFMKIKCVTVVNMDCGKV